MTATLYSGLTGVGTVHFSSADLTGYWHTLVTDLGSSHPVELDGLLRYLDLGWIAPLETDPDAANGMSGDFALLRVFLEFERQTHDFKTIATDIAGFSGFSYNFRMGVSVDVSVGIP